MEQKNQELPRFGFDSGNWAVVIAGRVVSEPQSQGAVKRAEATVRQWAARTKLPLAYVHMGTTANWVDEKDDAEGSYESAPAIVGLVLGHASSEAPLKLARSKIDASKINEIPAELWDALDGLSYGDQGVYLAPGGWTVASMFPGDAEYDADAQDFSSEHLATTCSEDSAPGARIDELTLTDELWIHATYA
jgi:hypothetical protein